MPAGQAPPLRQGKRHHHGRRSSSRRQGSAATSAGQALSFAKTSPMLQHSKRHRSDRTSTATTARQESPRRQDKRCHFGRVSAAAPA